ncbi:IucA/IucC family C-terminal-domain containing protein [Aureimonas ureilytica]|uniref:IucA/IucC family C-terminal-domain containing protein n=1 Tax=Aureimonas ureilytica TaxID=401562 RepID=UPI000AEF8F24|nr:IucA/IucC family C-terminal-domain containing protein [Aureimonas ureilytica]
MRATPRGRGGTGLPLAALLHQGADGVPVVVALAARSGRPLAQWIERFLYVLITSVLHLLVRLGLGFSTHGQNATIIVQDGWPVRLALRDFIDDGNVCDLDFPETQSLPKDVADVLLRLPPDYMRHFVHTTLFVCELRFVSTLLSERSGLSEAEFWRAARRVVDRYAERFPELAERLALFDILGETYPRLCLNRVRLFTHGYSDDAERPVPDWAGEVRNPLRAFETAAAT